MNKLKGIIQIACGIGLWVFGISIGIAWLTFCFGSVIIGILLLFLAPHILLLPFTFGLVPGNSLIFIGIGNLNSNKPSNTSQLDGL
jgi:hypothetical protein